MKFNKALKSFLEITLLISCFASAVVFYSYGFYNASFYYVTFSPIARYVLNNYPNLYNPYHFLFVSRVLHKDGAYYYPKSPVIYSDPQTLQVKKILMSREQVDFLVNSLRGSKKDFQRLVNKIKESDKTGFFYLSFSKDEQIFTGISYRASLCEGVDFTRSGLPIFIKNVLGLSGEEPWGRWSDADVAPFVRFEFFDSFPDRFTLELEANVFAPNIGEELTVNIGAKTYSLYLPEDYFVATLDVNLEGESVDVIEFIPPASVSPKDLGLGEDPRKLGIGFIRLSIIDQKAEFLFIDVLAESLEAGANIALMPYDYPSRLLRAAARKEESALRFNDAGMDEEKNTIFFSALSEQPLLKQIEVMERLGFSGICIDRRGYSDNGEDVAEQLTAILKTHPSLISDEGNILFFAFPASEPVDLSGLTAEQIMLKARFFVDEHGLRYESAISEGVDFTRSGLPLFIKNAQGLSEEESWGRWSDADVASSVLFEFFDFLPDRFTLELEANAFGPNIGKEFTVNIGSRTYSVHIPEAHFTVDIDIELEGERANKIEFIPPVPTSPKELGLSEDGRKLGIGFIGLRIIERK